MTPEQTNSTEPAADSNDSPASASQPQAQPPTETRPDSTPLAPPIAAAAPPAPGAPAPVAGRPIELGEALAREAESAMEQVTKGDDDASTDQPADGVKKPKKVWGPRVVQGGREYRKGTVVSVGPEAVFIEFGPKELGLLERRIFKEENLPNAGQEIEVVVDRYDPTESLYLCSLPGTVQKADWEMLEKGQVVEARVSGKNKGGLELEVAGHRAFMPASQIDVHRIEDLSVYIGEKMNCKVIRVDRSGKGNITLSRREVIAEERKEHVKELKDSLKEGAEIDGIVRKIMPFGAFVDMGGADGLLHVSDISHERIGNVEKHLKEGDTVRVKVLKLDWETGRHSLGLKQLQPDPYEDSLKEINEGDIITGRVAKLLDFGAFVEIADGIQGLVHISELDWKRVNKTSDAVQPNTTVKVKVLKIDGENRKISLSIKQATDRPAAPQGRGGGRGGRGRRGEEPDTRKPEEILKETPEFRRLREKSRQQDPKQSPEKVTTAKKEPGGLGSAGGMGFGLGDLKL